MSDIKTNPKPSIQRGYRLSIDAIGLRQADAIAHALRLIGMMTQNAHTKGHSCGGETGSASGNWEQLNFHVE